MNCSNCGQMSGPDAIRVSIGGTIVAEICEVCQKDVKVAKIVLSREDVAQPLTYDGYLPVASSR